MGVDSGCDLRVCRLPGDSFDVRLQVERRRHVRQVTEVDGVFPSSAPVWDELSTDEERRERELAIRRFGLAHAFEEKVHSARVAQIYSERYDDLVVAYLGDES